MLVRWYGRVLACHAGGIAGKGGAAVSLGGAEVLESHLGDAAGLLDGHRMVRKAPTIRPCSDQVRPVHQS